MNKLYTLLIIVFLAGCTPQYTSYNAANRAFIQLCDLNTIESAINTVGTSMTFIATCTKEK